MKTPAFEMMFEVATTLASPALQAWKAQGGKVVGYFCSMLPEELFMAAGLLPFRMRATGSTDNEAADAYFSNLNCTFPRHCLSVGLEGGFDFLDGLVCLNSCDHIRRLYDSWRRHIPTQFIEFVTLPRQSGPDQIAWYADEFRNLARKLEQHFGVEITAERLRQAIRLANETRALQRQLYDLRKREHPPVTGSDVLTTMVASTALPKAQYNQLLRDFLQELAERDGYAYRARLMITGGILDDPAWVRAIEEVGALVVADITCFGARLMWEDVDETVEDPYLALARYYLADRPSCPRMYDQQERRARFAVEMCKAFECDGIVGEKLMFCDQWNVEHYLLDADLKAAGIPFLSIDRTYLTSATGQLKTRIQAFIETMGK